MLAASQENDVTPRRISTRFGRWPSDLLAGRPKTEHPANAELIGQHTETPAPERIVQRHGDLTVFTEGPEYFLHFRLGLTVQAD